jgi:hypothetical protein
VDKKIVAKKIADKKIADKKNICGYEIFAHMK